MSGGIWTVNGKRHIKICGSINISKLKCSSSTFSVEKMKKNNKSEIACKETTSSRETLYDFYRGFFF